MAQFDEDGDIEAIWRLITIRKGGLTVIIVNVVLIRLWINTHRVIVTVYVLQQAPRFNRQESHSVWD